MRTIRFTSSQRKLAVLRLAIATAVTALIGLLGGAGVGHVALAGGTELPPHEEDLSPDAVAEALKGVSESLILVVAGGYGDGVAAATAEGDLALGDLQGFYIDEGANYEVLGMYLSQDPTLEEVRCGSPRADEVLLSCSSEGSDLHEGDVVQVRLPVYLKYFPASPESAATIRERLMTCSESPAGRPCPHDVVVGVSGSWRLDPETTYRMTAFRTRAGAEAFVELVRDVGGISVSVLRVRKLGGPYIGLGQEPAPDGSGPLVAALQGQEFYQR